MGEILKMKRTKKSVIIVLTMAIVVMLSLGATPGVGANEQNRPLDQTTYTTGEIIVNGVEIIAPRPSITDGVIMLPLRPIAKELGLDISWHGDEKRIGIGIGESNVLWIGRALFSSDGGLTTREFGPAPEIIDGCTFVPLPFFNFGLTGYSARVEEGKVIINQTGSAGFTFGRQAHAFHPETVDEFIPIFAAQLARYNKAAPQFWPNNAVIDSSVILEDVGTNNFWLITQTGQFAAISEKEITEMGVSRRQRADDFSFYEGGMYITISEKSVIDQIGADQLHVGAYDSILWLTHEGFHKWEQDEKWIKPEREKISNPSREEFFMDISARAKRNLLQRQLMQAVAEPDKPALVLDALATYEDYKIQNADDYNLTFYFDQIEGTAKYFEVISSLFIFYPDQVRNKEDLERAFAYLAQHEDDYIAIGVVSEAYYIGIFTGALLDRLGISWKERIIQTPLLTPLEILAGHYKDEKLPEPKQLTQEEIERVTEDIREKIRFLVERQVFMLTSLKQGLGDLTEKERQGMEAYIAYMLQNFEEMIKILPEAEQKAQEEFIKMISA